MPNCQQQLVTILTSKRNDMEQLLNLLKDEQRRIIDVDIAALEDLDDRKRELLGIMERGNAEYRQLLKEAAAELKVSRFENLSSLLPAVSPSLRENLKGLQARIVELGESLNRILEFNQGLLENSLRHVHQNLAFFNSLVNKSNTYGDAGTMVTGKRGSRLVCKEI